MWRSFGIRKLSMFIIISLTLYLIEHHLTNLRGLANALTSFASNHFPRVFLTISPTRAPSTLPWCQEDWWNDNPSPPHQELQCWLRPSRPSCKSSLSTNPPLLSFPETCKKASFDWGSKIVLKMYLPTGSSGKKEVHRCWNTLAIRSGLDIVILLTLILRMIVSHLKNIVCPTRKLSVILIRRRRILDYIKTSRFLYTCDFDRQQQTRLPFPSNTSQSCCSSSHSLRLSAWKTSRLVI